MAGQFDQLFQQVQHLITVIPTVQIFLVPFQMVPQPPQAIPALPTVVRHAIPSVVPPVLFAAVLL